MTQPKGDDEYLERITRALFAAGLNWRMIGNKWEGFRSAFSGFEVAKVARLSERDVTRLMKDQAIVRNEKKTRSTIYNAGEFLRLGREFGSFRKYLATFGKDEERLQEDLQERFHHLGPSSVRMFLWLVGHPLTPSKEEEGVDGRPPLAFPGWGWVAALVMNTGYLYLLFFGFQEIQALERDALGRSPVPVVSWFRKGFTLGRTTYLGVAMVMSVVVASAVNIAYGAAVYAAHPSVQLLQASQTPAVFLAQKVLGPGQELLVGIAFLIATVTTFVPAFLAAARHLSALGEDGYMPVSLANVSWAFTLVAIFLLAVGSQSFLVEITDFMVLISLGMITLSAVWLRRHAGRGWARGRGLPLIVGGVLPFRRGGLLHRPFGGGLRVCRGDIRIPDLRHHRARDSGRPALPLRLRASLCGRPGSVQARDSHVGPCGVGDLALWGRPEQPPRIGVRGVFGPARRERPVVRQSAAAHVRGLGGLARYRTAVAGLCRPFSGVRIMSAS